MVLLPLMLIIWWSVIGGAQEEYCDPYLSPPPNNPLGYRLRGDRCEGIYVQEVGGTTLRLVSLTTFFEDYVLSSGQNLLIEWTTPDRREVHLRAQSLRYRLYYRMDTVRPSGGTLYRWPIPILVALRISQPDLGVIGWTQYLIGGKNSVVYVPLRVSQKDQTHQVQSYRLVLVPGVQLTEVYTSLAPLGADGRPGLFLHRDIPLRYGYYPANQGIAIHIPFAELQQSGVYYLSIGARLRGGGADALTCLFYHSDRQEVH